MVKRKAAKKAAAKKAPARAAKKAPKKHVSRARPAKSGDQLELIKGVRYTDLDRLCRDIGSNRDEINDLKEVGTTLELAALKAMRVHGVTGYKNAGVTLMRNQGDETLVVKRDRSGKASDSGGGAMNQPAEPEQGTGQEPGAISDALTEGQGDEDTDQE